MKRRETQPSDSRRASRLEFARVGALFAVVLGAVVTAGCGQILGVNEYSIDPTNGASRCDALHAPDTTGRGCNTVVGVPASACASGFTSDNNGGCKDGLPATCPDGKLPAPGQECTGFFCVDGYFKNYVTETLPDGGVGHKFDASETLYVNGAVAPGGDGSTQTPFQTIGQAIAAAGQNAMLILVAPGTYRESLNVTAPLTIVGSGAGPASPDCPSPVVIQAPDSSTPAVKVSTSAASGTWLGLLQITGGSAGIEVDGAESVETSNVWVHDTSGPGLVVEDAAAGNALAADHSPASAQINGITLIERAVGAGVEVYGSKFEATDTTDNPLVVRDTRPLADGREGYGIALHPDPISAAAAPPNQAHQAELTLSGAVLDGNAGAGLFVDGSNATVTDTVIRNTHANGLGEGRGVVVQRRPLGPVSASLTLSGSIVEQSHDVGVLVIDSPAPQDGSAGVTATIANTTIRDIGNDATDGGATACIGTGLQVRSDGFRTVNSHTPPIVLQNSLIEGARREGIRVLGARVDVRQSIVRGTTGCGGSLGDGIAAYADTLIPTSLNVTQSRVDSSARAGIAAFGATVNVTSSIVDGCGTVPIAKVQRGGQEAAVQTAGGGCGCKSVGAACSAESPPTTPTPSLRGGNGCDAFHDGVCLSNCWEDDVSRLQAGATADAGEPTKKLVGVVFWTPDDLNMAPALTDAQGCIHWGGLQPLSSPVFADGRDVRDGDAESSGYMPFIWKARVGPHSGNLGLQSEADNTVAWNAFTGDAVTVGTPLDARMTPTLFVLTVDQSAQAAIAKGEDVYVLHGIAGVQLEPASSGVVGRPLYVTPGGILDSSPTTTAMTTAGAGAFFNVAPGEALIRLLPPAGSASIHCTDPWNAIAADQGWTDNDVVPPDEVSLLTRPGYNSVVYALCSVE